MQGGRLQQHDGVAQLPPGNEPERATLRCRMAQHDSGQRCHQLAVGIGQAQGAVIARRGKFWGRDVLPTEGSRPTQNAHSLTAPPPPAPRHPLQALALSHFGHRKRRAPCVRDAPEPPGDACSAVARLRASLSCNNPSSFSSKSSSTAALAFPYCIRTLHAPWSSLPS